MPNRFVKLPTTRLSRRIVGWVFVSVIVIETIIFIPSHNNRHRELLANLRTVSSAAIAALTKGAAGSGDDTAAAALTRLERLVGHARITGGTLFNTGGEALGTFGEPPRSNAADLGPGEGVRHPAQRRYDANMSEALALPGVVLIVGHDTRAVQRELASYGMRIAGLVVIISIFVTAGAWLALDPIVVRPILRLHRDLGRAGHAIRNDLPVPDFNALRRDAADELGDVRRAFQQMVQQVLEAIDERKKAQDALQASLSDVKAVSRVLRQELEAGRAIQANFFPTRLPAPSGWEAAAYFCPARQVAGDFYDVFHLPGDHLGIVVGDVCDKGVGAALFMGLFRSLIRIFSGQTVPAGDSLREPGPGGESAGGRPAGTPRGAVLPQDALRAVMLTNDYIAHNHGDLAMFATLFFGVLNVHSGRLTYINGGHEPVLVVGGGGGVRRRLSRTGPVVGVQRGVRYGVAAVDLAPGETLLGYTDGVTEATAADGTLFTQRRLYKMLRDGGRSAKELLDALAGAVARHTGSAEQFDDIAMLALRRLSAEAVSTGIRPVAPWGGDEEPRRDGNA